MPSTVLSTKSSRHPPSARDRTHNPTDRASTTMGSRRRIEKKRSIHGSKKAVSSPPKATASAQLMRIFLNNRLGTKTEIACSPSDTIGAFKKVAAAYLGTRPEAMMLKRQGERPMKDFLTLEDYAIGDGSSLDLEVDTGDS